MAKLGNTTYKPNFTRTTNFTIMTDPTKMANYTNMVTTNSNQKKSNIITTKKNETILDFKKTNIITIIAKANHKQTIANWDANSIWGNVVSANHYFNRYGQIIKISNTKLKHTDTNYLMQQAANFTGYQLPSVTYSCLARYLILMSASIY